MDNKIKLEDTCLTVEQAKELQELGVDMSDSIKSEMKAISPHNYTGIF